MKKKSKQSETKAVYTENFRHGLSLKPGLKPFSGFKPYKKT